MMNEPAADARFNIASEPVLNREIRVIPRDSIPGRALVVVIAIMTFLACLTAGAALLVAHASENWRADVLRDITIQVKPRPGDDVESIIAKVSSIVSAAPGVKSVYVYSERDTAKLLQPWLGEGLDLSLLPIPRVLIVHLEGGSGNGVAALRAILAGAAPQASLDDHRAWAARIGTMAKAVVALAFVLFALVIVALATAIGFATRGAMAGTREVIEVLHFVGASDLFIAMEFQSHFVRLALRGALIGVFGALAFFLALLALSAWWSSAPGGEEIAAMFGAFALSASDYPAISLVGVGVTILTGLLSRAIVLNNLRELR